MQVALVEAWDATDRAADFPFAERIPQADKVRQAVLDFAHQGMLPRADVTARVRSLVAEQAGDLGALTNWAITRPGFPLAIPGIIDRRVAEIIAAVEAARPGGAAAALAALEGSLPPGLPAGRIDGRLEIMEQLQRLANAITGTQAELLSAADPGTMAATYGRDFLGHRCCLAAHRRGVP